MTRIGFDGERASTPDANLSERNYYFACEDHSKVFHEAEGRLGASVVL